MSGRDPTRRFSGRVENYARYRPGYPREIVALLRGECGLSENSVVADLGSGTGILSRLFLENGNRVFGVEPNGEMRAAGERFLESYERFTSVAATAEATTLSSASVDFVTAGQAFHWFDPRSARAEFARISKPGGWTVLVWNTRRKEGTPFFEAYERLSNTYGTDYAEVAHNQHGSLEEVRAFFSPSAVEAATFDNRQVLDLEGLKGRLLSSSYVPSEGELNNPEMLRELEEIFGEHQEKGEVTMEYETRVYYGRLR